MVESARNSKRGHFIGLKTNYESISLVARTSYELVVHGVLERRAAEQRLLLDGRGGRGELHGIVPIRKILIRTKSKIFPPEPT